MDLDSLIEGGGALKIFAAIIFFMIAMVAMIAVGAYALTASTPAQEPVISTQPSLEPSLIPSLLPCPSPSVKPSADPTKDPHMVKFSPTPLPTPEPTPLPYTHISVKSLPLQEHYTELQPIDLFCVLTNDGQSFIRNITIEITGYKGVYGVEGKLKQATLTYYFEYVNMYPGADHVITRSFIIPQFTPDGIPGKDAPAGKYMAGSYDIHVQFYADNRPAGTYDAYNIKVYSVAPLGSS